MSLSKRETILLIFLLLVGLFFVEYRFVVTPGISKYESLQTQDQELQAQIDDINLKLLIAEQNKKKRDEALNAIEETSKVFLNPLKSDVLLYYTYDLMNRNGFLPDTYSIYPIAVKVPVPEMIEVKSITYDLARAAQEYNTIRHEKGNEEPTQEEPILSEVEYAEFLIHATGNYEQVKELLNDIHSHRRTIVISGMDLLINTVVVPEEPEPEEPTEPTEPVDEIPPEDVLQVNQLAVSIRINYFGIEKITPTQDEFNSWSRPGFDAGIDNPFKEILPEPEPEEPTEPEGTPTET